MKKVLIAMDYNPTAQKVAETGFSIGRSMNAEITLLHVIADPSYYASSVFDPIMGFGGYLNVDLFKPDFINELTRESIHFLEKVRKHLGDDHIQVLVKAGDFPQSILDAAKECNSDVIVMGSHSHRWLDNILIGSATEKVLHRTPVPLLIIPTRKQY